MARLSQRYIDRIPDLWQNGFRMLQQSKTRSKLRGDDNYYHAMNVIAAIRRELMRCKSVDELLDKYFMEDNDWCLQIAKEVAPDAPAYARRLALVEDAAYFFRFQELRRSKSGNMNQIRFWGANHNSLPENPTIQHPGTAQNATHHHTFPLKLFWLYVIAVAQYQAPTVP